MDITQASQSLSEALQALARLEQALKEQNNRAIGAELYKLRRALTELQQKLEKNWQKLESKPKSRKKVA